jgi:hypothetical protein
MFRQCEAIITIIIIIIIIIRHNLPIQVNGEAKKPLLVYRSTGCAMTDTQSCCDVRVGRVTQK